MKYLVIFDLDGTIEDSRYDMALSVNRIRRLYNLPPLPSDALQTLVNKGMNFLYKNCFPELIKNDEIPEDLKRKYEIDYANHIVEHTRIYEGIDKVIKEIYKKHYLFLYTNKPQKLTEILLKKLNLLEYFTSIIGGDLYPLSKPSPEPVLKEIENKKLNDISNIYVIGDSEIDIQTARNLNAVSLWCKWGYLNQTPEIPPNYIVQQPEEIISIIPLTPL